MLTRIPQVSHYCPLTQTLKQPGPQIGRSLGQRWSHRLYIRSTTEELQYRWYVRTVQEDSFIFQSFSWFAPLNALHYIHILNFIVWRIFCDRVSDAFIGLLFPLPLALPLSLPPSLSISFLTYFFQLHLFIIFYVPCHAVPCCTVLCYAMLYCSVCCRVDTEEQQLTRCLSSPL